jgi:hypothetical protein
MIGLKFLTLNSIGLIRLLHLGYKLTRSPTTANRHSRSSLSASHLATPFSVLHERPATQIRSLLIRFAPTKTFFSALVALSPPCTRDLIPMIRLKYYIYMTGNAILATKGR